MENQACLVGPADRKTEIPDALKARKTLKRCCGNPQQLTLLTAEKLGSCKKEEPEAAAIGTGEYFQNVGLNAVECSDMSELLDLFTLATVACEVESSTRHRQFVKKRRTPRNALWINRIPRVQNGNCKRVLPPLGADTAKIQRIESLTGRYTPWLEKAVQQPDSSVLPKSKNVNICSNRVILKFGTQQQSTGGKMTNKCYRVKLTKVSKGNRGPPGMPKSRERGPPAKDTRVQGVAKRILQFVGDGSTAEKFIRAALGNNPDTSKALRLLLAQHKVYRVGDGGRGKAFMYVATPAGLRELENQGSSEDDALVPHRLNDHQDDQVTPTDELVAPSNAPEVLLASHYPPRDVKTCLRMAASPPVAVSQSVLQAVLGKNMGMDDH